MCATSSLSKLLGLGQHAILRINSLLEIHMVIGFPPASHLLGLTHFGHTTSSTTRAISQFPVMHMDGITVKKAKNDTDGTRLALVDG